MFHLGAICVIPRLFELTPFQAVGMSLVIFCLLSGNFAWWTEGNAPYPALPILLVGVAMVVVGFLKRSTTPSPISYWPYTCGLFLVFFSDWLTRGYNFFQGPSIRGEILLFSVISAFILSNARLSLFRVMPILAGLLLFFSFLIESDGRILFSDDHSVFFYRLSLLKEQFPSIPFYNPLWNGGIDARDFFATGALNFFTLFAPFIYSIPLDYTYTVLVALLLFGVFPLSVWISGKQLRLTCPAPELAATLALGTGLLWYRWALKYGTLGFITSTCLMPLAVILALQVIDRTTPLTPKRIFACTVVFSLTLCWSLSGVALLPIVAIALFSIRAFFQKKGVAVLAGILLALNVPWIVLFFQVSKVGSFVQVENRGGAKPPSTIRTKHKEVTRESVVKHLRENSVSTNPLILLLGIPGILFLPKGARRAFGLLALWLLFVGTVLVVKKPQLELDRMLLVLAVFLTVPTGELLSRLGEEARHSRWKRIPASLAFGFLLCTPFVSAAAVTNRTVEHFFFGGPAIGEMAEVLRREVTGGRAFFSGCVLHELNEGHLAPLVLWTGRPLIASSYAHSIWKYQQPIPSELMSEGDEGIRRYMDLYNVSHVFAHEPLWRRYFAERPTEYELIWKDTPFFLFRRAHFNDDYFLEGSGSVATQSIHEVRLTPSTPDLVLKFHYFPFLRSSDCQLEPKQITPTITFIQLKGCPVGKEVVIDSKSPVWRMING
jgi:hypothetical protein